jgi:hypothetical protein
MCRIAPQVEEPGVNMLGVAIYVIHGILIIEIPSRSNKDHDFSAISQACGCRARNARRRYSNTAYTDPEANTRATIFTDLPYTTPAARLPCVDSPHATEIAAGLMLVTTVGLLILFQAHQISSRSVRVLLKPPSIGSGSIGRVAQQSRTEVAIPQAPLRKQEFSSPPLKQS